MFCYRGQGRLEHRWQVAGRKAIGRGWEKGGPRAHHLMAGPRAELTLWGPCRV